MTELQSLLSRGDRPVARTLPNRTGKGTYFEQLIQCYLTNEPSYKDLNSEVQTYADWARSQGQKAQDTGIDLVARTRTGELHAVQCKLSAEDYRLQKKDIDSFLTASGKKSFSHRIILSTTNDWSIHAEEALRDQQPPVTKIDLHDLEVSQIDWQRYQPKKAPKLKPRKTPRPHRESAVKAVKAGQELAELHIGYEKVKPYPVTVDVGATGRSPLQQERIYRVEKMRYGKIKVNGKAKRRRRATGRSPLHCHNEHITLKDIPLEAYDYVVNGKSALDWVVERQCVKTDKDSGIVNDANAWAVETMGNARYPLELFMRVVTVSLETVRIVGGLPGLEVGK